MKVVILAGGLGSRLQEETVNRPKPMVEIGGRPMLYHIMSSYRKYGFRDFIVALGYRGEFIKQYFLNYYQLKRNITVHLHDGKTSIEDVGDHEDWRVQLIDTGAETQTGGRVKRLAPWIGKEAFMLTYGDGVSDVDINKLIAFHKSHGRLATVTAVRPPARFGGLKFNGDQIEEFTEKPQVGEGWINGGFFVFEPGVLDYIEGGDPTVLERQPLERLAADGQLMAYKHPDFWHCMDTLRDVRMLDDMCQRKDTPWLEGPRQQAKAPGEQ